MLSVLCITGIRIKKIGKKKNGFIALAISGKKSKL